MKKSKRRDRPMFRTPFFFISTSWSYPARARCQGSVRATTNAWKGSGLVPCGGSWRGDRRGRIDRPPHAVTYVGHPRKSRRSRKHGRKCKVGLRSAAASEGGAAGGTHGAAGEQRQEARVRHPATYASLLVITAIGGRAGIRVGHRAYGKAQCCGGSSCLLRSRRERAIGNPSQGASPRTTHLTEQWVPAWTSRQPPSTGAPRSAQVTPPKSSAHGIACCGPLSTVG